MRKPKTMTKKEWNKFNAAQQRVFSMTYRGIQVHLKGKHFLHPETPPLTPEMQGTIAHNAAWIAAEALKGRRLVVVT